MSFSESQAIQKLREQIAEKERLLADAVIATPAARDELERELASGKAELMRLQQALIFLKLQDIGQNIGKPVRSIEIRGRAVSIYLPSPELWNELEILEKMEDRARYYLFGWATDILNTVSRHCARQEFSGSPDYLAMLMTAILYFWDTRIPFVASWHGFVKHALGVFLFTCVNGYLTLKRAEKLTQLNPDLAEDEKLRGQKRFAQVAGLCQDPRKNCRLTKNFPQKAKLMNL